MLQNYNTYRILQLFFDQPTKLFQLRELSRLADIGLPSVINHVKKLEKYGFVRKEKKNIYESYVANKDNDRYRLYKKNDLTLRLNESGFVKYVTDSIMPNAVIIFGSASRGEDIETSDIDIFILSKEEKLDFKKFESILKRRINIYFETDIKNLSKELLNNIINGIKIYGYVKVA
jgi:predicted nucleotidyltransferase